MKKLLKNEFKTINFEEIIKDIERNVWDNTKTSVIEFKIGEDNLTIKGSIYEPVYDCYESTVEIYLNEECFFAEESYSFAPYKVEVEQKGKYDSIKKALCMLQEKYH